MLVQIKNTEPYDTVMKLAVHLPNGQTAFQCPVHGFMWGRAAQMPQHSCEYCFIMYLMKLEATVPPEKREEWMTTVTTQMLKLEKEMRDTGEVGIDIRPAPLATEVILDPSDVDYFNKKEEVVVDG